MSLRPDESLQTLLPHMKNTAVILTGIQDHGNGKIKQKIQSNNGLLMNA